MKQLKTALTLLLLTALVVTACKKDDDDNPSSNPELLVNGNVSGIVTDQFDEPVADVLVTMSTYTSTTDENGYFNFTNVEINTKGSLITAEKDAYFYNSKFVSSKLNKQNFTKIKLIKKILTGSFTANTGGSISTSDGATVEFVANAVKKVDGEAYTGNVNVYLTWLDPTSPDLAQKMPGDLRATNADNEQQQLTTYGMIGVELEGDAGETLNIADGQTATIELPIPNSLLPNAPSSIPLWHFDESSGYWMEEGEATLLGGKYVGTVSHFSFWNCDVPNDFIWLEGSVTAEPGFSIENILIQVTDNSNGVSANAYTNEEGEFAGYVPKDIPLVLTAFGNCDNFVLNENIGPFSGDNSLPPFNLVFPNELLTISGNLVDCNNTPLTNGYFKLNYDIYLEIDYNGNFTKSISPCGISSLTGTAYDLDNLKKSNTITYDINGLSNLDVGTINVCDEDLIEYIKFTIDGDDYIIVDTLYAKKSYIGGNLSIIGRSKLSLNNTLYYRTHFSLGVEATEPGNYTPFSTYIGGKNEPQDYNIICEAAGGDVSFPDCSSIDFNITTLEDVGGFVIGSFEGTMNKWLSPISYPVSAEFKVIIKE